MKRGGVWLQTAHPSCSGGQQGLPMSLQINPIVLLPQFLQSWMPGMHHHNHVQQDVLLITRHGDLWWVGLYFCFLLSAVEKIKPQARADMAFDCQCQQTHLFEVLPRGVER